MCKSLIGKNQTNLLPYYPILDEIEFQSEFINLQKGLMKFAFSLKKYVTLLQNHIQKEENVLFPMANKVLNEQKQKEIFEQFETIEEEVVGHGIHEEYHNILKQLENKYLG